MYEFVFPTFSIAFLALTAANLLFGLLRVGRPSIGLYLVGLNLLLALGNLVLAVIAVGSGLTAKTSTVEYFFYAVCAFLVPLAGVAFTLIERNRFAYYVYSIVSFTEFVMLVRMHQIWFGA